MSKFYAVELSIVAIVQVEDDDWGTDAEIAALNHARDIVNDTAPEAKMLRQIQSLKDLSTYGWDGMCLPYNGDDSTSLKDLLPEADHGST